MANSNSRIEAAFDPCATELGTMIDHKAQSQNASAIDRSRFITWLTTPLLAFSWVVTLSACATTPTPIPLATGATAPTSQSASITSNPNLTADEIGKRFLELIEGLGSRSELNLDLVRKALGLEFSTVPGDEHHFVSEVRLGPNWSYVVGFLEETRSNQESVYLDFRNATARFSDMTSICNLDFEYYHDALVTMGFRAVEIRGEIGQLESWRYYKNDIVMQIDPQNAVPGGTGRLCANSIRMWNGR